MDRSSNLIFLILAAFAAVIFSALPSDAGPPVGKYRVFEFSCTTSAVRITGPSAGESFTNFQVRNTSETEVWLGGDDVNITDKGWPLCTDATLCARSFQEIEGSLSSLYCIASGSPLTVQIWAAR